MRHDVAVLGLSFVVDEGMMAEDEEGAVTVKTGMEWWRRLMMGLVLMVLHECASMSSWDL